MNYDIFISYSRKDSAIADRICAALDKAGITYFIDRQGIAGGMEFPEILARAIIDSKVFLLLASENSYQSKFTNSEITFAFNKKERNSIIPYIIDDSEMPVGMQFVFSAINWRNLNTHPIETTLIDDLLAMLGRTRRQAAPKAEPQPASPQKPTASELEQWCENSIKCRREGELADAIDWARKAAENGSAEGMYLLALEYEYGSKVLPENPEKSARWMLEAARGGYADAQTNMGNYYGRGYGVAKDLAQAEHWFVEGAEQGNSKKQCNLGYEFRRGKFVAQDYEKSLYWLRKSADQGLAEAHRHIADAYLYGYGVPRNRQEGIRWLTLAAEKGDAFARRDLANLNK